MKNKIAFFIGDMSHSGGTERVLSIVATGLAERGWQISVFSLNGRENVFFPLHEAVRVHWIEEEKKMPGIAGKLLAIRNILKQEKTDFLIDVDIILCYYSFLLKWWMPKLHWISWEHFNFFYRFRRKRFLRKIARWLVSRFSEHLVVISEEDKEYYRENLRLKCGLTRIYNPNPYEGQSAKREERKMILAAGRLTGVKGFDLLIKSWSLLERKYPEWEVIIAGEGEDRALLEEQKGALKNLHFIGNITNIEKFYSEAAFFVLSSRDEGFGMVVLEAMDFSLPVVSFSCKAGPGEIVIEGENGFLVEEEDTEEFAAKMELLMKDEQLRRKMGRKAFLSTCRFDKEKILDEWESLLHTFEE